MNTDTYVHTTKSNSKVVSMYVCIRHMRVVGVYANVCMYVFARTQPILFAGNV